MYYLFYSALISALAFGFGVTQLKDGTGILQKCIKPDNTLYQQVMKLDATVTVFISDEKSMVFPNVSRKFRDGTVCSVFKNVADIPSGGVQFSQTYYISGITDKLKSEKEFDNYTIIIFQEYLSWYHSFYSEYDLIINELLQSKTFNNLTRLQTKTPSGQRLYFQNKQRDSKIITAIKSFIGLILLDIVSLLYIYSTIISAPAFLVTLIDAFNLRSSVSRLNVYKVFPWLGLYMHPLDRRPASNHSSQYISRAMLIFFFFVYFIYLGSMVFLGYFLFILPQRSGLSQNYYGYVALMEFACHLLLRTRTSIKFFPSIYMINQLAFMFYCNYVELGYKNWLFLCNTSLTLCFLTIILLKIQIPAATVWNKTMNYTPTQGRPRTLYFPSFNLLWMNDIPDLWTMCVPLFGRSFFRRQELSVVDQEYELLRGTMNAHQLH